MYDECSYWDLQPALLGKWSMWSYSTLLRNLCLSMMICGGGGVRGRDGFGDGDNDDNDDDDDDDWTDTGTLELKREIKLKSAGTWLWSFKGYEELTYNF